MRPARDSNPLDWLTLSFLPRLGPVTIRRLIERFDGPGAALDASPKQLAEVAGIGAKLAADLVTPDHRRAAQDLARSELKRCQVAGIVFLPLDHPAYPTLLAAIHDPPAILRLRGDLDLLARPAVAIVGSRAASDYGRQVSFRLARDLAGQGFTVVSGMALGIDGEAHQGALSGDGSTLGVLGCGLDVVYPRNHARLFGQVMERGALLSEYPLGTRPEGFRFPARNRIISGLSLGVVVVEATERSGSLITARLALEQGREVFAVPGRVDSLKSSGSHRLLKEGAKLVQSVDDVVEELAFARARGGSGVPPSSPAQPPLSEAESRIYDLLDVYPRTIDEITRSAPCPAAEVVEMLLLLELKGAIRQLPGQQYERVGDSSRP